MADTQRSDVHFHGVKQLACTQRESGFGGFVCGLGVVAWVGFWFVFGGFVFCYFASDGRYRFCSQDKAYEAFVLPFSSGERRPLHLAGF
jgi:hypothetical protein